MLGDGELMKIKGRSVEEGDPRVGGGVVLGVMLSRLHCPIVCVCECVTTNPINRCNYRAPIKNEGREKIMNKSTVEIVAE